MADEKPKHVDWSFVGQNMLLGAAGLMVLLLASINSEIRQLRETYAASNALFSAKLNEHDKILVDHEIRIRRQEERR